MAYQNEEFTEAKAKRFAEIYVFEQLGNAAKAYTQLYEEFGLELPKFPRNQASWYLTTPYVKRWVEHYREMAREQFEVNKDEIVASLKELAFDRDKPDKTRLTALKQLTDMGGFATHNVNVSGSQDIVVSLVE